MKKYLIAILIAFPCFLKAQTPGQIKACEKFMEVSGVKSNFNNTLGAVLGTQLARIPADKRVKFGEVMKTFMGKYFSYEILKPKLIKLYTDEFSEAELKDLTSFYLTPTGKKYASKVPILTQKGMQVGITAVQEHQAELQTMMKEAFAKDKN